MTASGLNRFLVELDRPELLAADIQAIAARSRAAALEMRGEGAAVRFLRTIYVPEDGRCFLLFEGESMGQVGEAAGRAGLVTGSLVEAVRLDADLTA